MKLMPVLLLVFFAFIIDSKYSFYDSFVHKLNAASVFEMSDGYFDHALTLKSDGTFDYIKTAGSCTSFESYVIAGTCTVKNNKLMLNPVQLEFEVDFLEKETYKGSYFESRGTYIKKDYDIINTDKDGVLLLSPSSVRSFHEFFEINDYEYLADWYNSSTDIFNPREVFTQIHSNIEKSEINIPELPIRFQSLFKTERLHAEVIETLNSFTDVPPGIIIDKGSSHGVVNHQIFENSNGMEFRIFQVYDTTSYARGLYNFISESQVGDIVFCGN